MYNNKLFYIFVCKSQKKKSYEKIYCVLLVLLVNTTLLFGQSAQISIIGDATPGGWTTDTDLTTTDGISYSLSGVTLTSGGLKFREGHAWNYPTLKNWGGTTFPNGTGVLNGGNIPVQAGNYNVTININTGEYSFVSAVTYDVVKITGGDSTYSASTTDGVQYKYENAAFSSDANSQFEVNNTEYWGNTIFPSGIAVANGQIPVLANNYNVLFNLTTKEYSFNFVTISLIGTSVGDGTQKMTLFYLLQMELTIPKPV